MTFWPNVVVATPAHSGVGASLSYRSELLLAPGTLVRVPLGQREVLGVVWECATEPPEGLTEAQTKAVASVLDGLPPLNARWRQLVKFAAQYYQRSLGEVALAALPPQLRELSNEQLARRLKRQAKAAHTLKTTTPTDAAPAPAASDGHDLSDEQRQALAALHSAQAPVLLFGATGSGKTEVYLRATREVLDTATPEGSSPTQVLVMVPEINLTPQLQARFQERFAHLGKERVVSLHSGLTPAQRLKSWLSAHAGHARLILGTRMAILASMPRLRLIVVDEEHDPSYKQQEGARYSARDLAVYRAKLETEDAGDGKVCSVMLGSATPSLESWQATITGRYQRLTMSERVGTAVEGEADVHIGRLPQVRGVDMNHQPKHAVIAPPLLDAIAQRVARGEQSLIFLNRRGYAPVLACHDCGWKSECPHCSAYRVFHKIDRTLRCHHCGFTERVPRACPSCGNIDIAPVGRGTERLEEHLAELLADVKRPDGGAVRIARIDADTTRLKGALESQLASVHSGEVDVLVGTQMIAKGHDFRHITLVAAINPDGALFSSDFRAPERLFSLLMQAAGRAGRDARHSAASEMWVQTFHPTHPLFAALKAHDYPKFADQQLAERQAAGMSPFGYSALVRAEAKDQSVAQGFLNAAAAAVAFDEEHPQVMAYPAVPMMIQRVANIERAQMLVESSSRVALQRFLAAWQPVLFETRRQADFKSLVRWAIDVDPIAI
ncbi:MAG: primosomal protein N' [Hydrogenophaga sp.]|nr:primosomal protein N' [Hydrogenophaga sp.]